MEEKRKLKEEVRPKICFLSVNPTVPSFFGPTLVLDIGDFFSSIFMVF